MFQKSFAIVGFVVRDSAEVICVDCARRHFASFADLAPAAWDLDLGDLVHQVAAYEGLDEEDLGSVVFADQVEEGEACAHCREEI